MNSKSIEVAQKSNLKEKDIESTRQRIKVLREQLQAAEKILNANEQSLDELKSHKRALDSRMTKLQNMKRVQQQLLQKILAPLSTSSSTAIIQNNKMGSSTLPPLPKYSPPPLSSNPLPPPPPPASSSAQSTTAKTSSSFASNLTPKKMTLGEEVAATVESKSKDILHRPQSLSSLRPNLNVSKSTDLKLEEIGKSSMNKAEAVSGKSDGLIVSAKVVNVANSNFKQKNNRNGSKIHSLKKNDKEMSDAKKAELVKMKKLHSYLENMTVKKKKKAHIFIIQNLRKKKHSNHLLKNKRPIIRTYIAIHSTFGRTNSRQI